MKYADKLSKMTDIQLRNEANAKIWFCATYDSFNTQLAECQEILKECQKRGKVKIYHQEYENLNSDLYE